MAQQLPRRVWTEAELAANREATRREWGMADDWSNWISDQANAPDVARDYAKWLSRP